MILITTPTSLSNNYLSIQPNYFTKLMDLNEMALGINYFNIGDIRGQHLQSIDSAHRYTMSELRDEFHKFVETRELITNITLIKLSTKELICP